MGLSLQAQIKVPQKPEVSITDENPFLDASGYTDFENNVGKGIYFPETDLTTWEFKLDNVNPSNFSTYFNGLLVFNKGTGQTISDPQKGGKQVNVVPGFYYFYNPKGVQNQSVAEGSWLPISTVANGVPGAGGNPGGGVTPPGGGGTPSNPNLSVAVEPAGFEGTYTAGTPVGPGNKVKFKLINNSFFPINHLDLSDAFSISNPGSNNLQVWGRGQNNDISLKSGESITLSYNLTGTPNAGVLAAFFDKNGLHAEQSINIGKGTATFTNPSITANVVSINSAGASVQGVIDNNSHRLTIKIPYTNGKGAYDAVSVTKASAEGQGGDINDLTLKIAEGSFSGRGNLTASIEVGGDGVYQVRQIPAGEYYTIATFPVSMGNATFTVEVKGFGGYTSTQTQSFNKNFTRNNCSSGYYGTSVNYSREATATAVSAISQADADKKAREKALAEATKLVNDGGQNHANQNGQCKKSSNSGGGTGGGYSLRKWRVDITLDRSKYTSISCLDETHNSRRGILTIKDGVEYVWAYTKAEAERKAGLGGFSIGCDENLRIIGNSDGILYKKTATLVY
ncbi:DUF5977 domain-containing protein [Ornithobacterium rhinotracheale]|uniref:DUF5977 domain-containing protein n=1 Tax=Ornithobacterium rhinotracheale TaxID=28251 RepID=UPI001FF2918D|nr:DUF5977 domain-containing protein [Ornithobacterium rhinotracheale]MCK0205020.1 DUF5977 domain-containing protein [Ornithobacterium rhinotracheale]